MGKKTIIFGGAFCLAIFLTSPAFSGTTSDKGPGCGLGKVAWEGSSLDSQAIGPQLLMSTTNNTILPWQAFGITSGNFGCTNNGKLWAERKTSMFAHINFDNLSQEMAQGHGEHLTSLAILMSIPAEKHKEFFSLTQQKYATLVQNGEASPVAIIKALNDSIANHPILAKASQ
jgi:hypothetical protein